jgi:hypothetical protein
MAHTLIAGLGVQDTVDGADQCMPTDSERLH